MSIRDGDLSLKKFLLLSSQNIEGALKINSRIYKAIDEIDSHWLHLLFPETRHQDNQSVCSLMTNAHNFFRASISLVLAGHPTPVYSLFRTSLESSLYAVAISLKPELEEAWIKRGLDVASRKLCRREFTAGNMFKYLAVVNPGLAADCQLIYDLYIEYGAHPNINGTFTFIEPGPGKNDNSVLVNYLQGSGRETRIAAFQVVQLAEMIMHISLYSMPRRTVELGTKKFLEGFSPNINLQHFGL